MNHRAVRGGVAAAVVGLAVLVVSGCSSDASVVVDGGDETSVFRPWPSRFSPDGMLGARLVDGEFGSVTHRDGHRLTIATPGDSADSTTVWVFGGDSVYGSSVPDDGTVASNLVRLGAERGRALDSVNFGVPADSSAQEYLRFAEALADLDATGGRPPDVAVFVDGWNDLQLAWFRARTGRSGADELGRLALTDSELELLGAADVHIGDDAYADSKFLDSALDIASTHYARAASLIDALAVQRGVAVVRVWLGNSTGTVPASLSQRVADAAGVVVDRSQVETIDLTTEVDAPGSESGSRQLAVAILDALPGA